MLLISTRGVAQGKMVAQGTAFVVNSNGYLVTNVHVIKDEEKVQVILGDRTYEATVLSMDEKHDLAVLQIKAKGLTSLPLTDSNAVKVGQEVRAFGFPMASILGDSLKVTRGTVSGIENRDTTKVLQIDAAVNHGNSGGPLVNERGEVVGVVYQRFEGNIVGSADAMPINYVKTLLRDEGVEFTTTGAPATLSGPDLVDRVSPSVAMVLTTLKSVARLHLDSDPSGAKVFIDDLEQKDKLTPCDLEIDLGAAQNKTITVRVSTLGYKSDPSTVPLTLGTSSNLKIPMVKIAALRFDGFYLDDKAADNGQSCYRFFADGNIKKWIKPKSKGIQWAWDNRLQSDSKEDRDTGDYHYELMNETVNIWYKPSSSITFVLTHMNCQVLNDAMLITSKPVDKNGNREIFSFPMTFIPMK